MLECKILSPDPEISAQYVGSSAPWALWGISVFGSPTRKNPPMVQINICVDTHEGP